MELGELAHEREADAGAAPSARRGALHLVEPVEHALDLVVRDPDAGVLDRADEAIPADAAAHRDAPGRASVPSVKRIAFERRFSTIFSSLSRSTGNGGSGADSVARASMTCRCAASGFPLSTSEPMSSRTSTSSRRRNSCLASSRERSRSVLMCRSSRCAFRSMSSRSARSSGEEAFAPESSSSRGARMSMSGVRSSCETFVKKFVFTRSSSICVSTSRFCASSSRFSVRNARTSASILPRKSTTSAAESVPALRSFAGGTPVKRHANTHCAAKQAQSVTSAPQDRLAEQEDGREREQERVDVRRPTAATRRTSPAWCR